MHSFLEYNFLHLIHGSILVKLQQLVGHLISAAVWVGQIAWWDDGLAGPCINGGCVVLWEELKTGYPLKQ